MKAVCPRDQIAYDVEVGCADCVARKAEVAAKAFKIVVGCQGPPLDVPTFESFDDPSLVEMFGKSFVDGLKAAHRASLPGKAIAVGTDANGSDVDDDLDDPFCGLGYD